MAKTVTRAEIIDNITKKIKLPHHQASHFLEVVLETMESSLADKGKIKIVSFGSFKVRQKSKRMGRNPKTGKEFVITSRRVLSFKPSPYLREKVQSYKL